jgi:hypothetical protein
MATVRDLSDAKQMSAEIDVIGPRVGFLINPNDCTLCVIKGLIPLQVCR